MSVSVYSVVIAILWFSLAVLAGRAALWNVGRYGLVFAGTIFLMALVRMFVPLDLTNAVVLQSEVAYPAVQDWLREPLAGGLTRGAGLFLLWAAGAAIYLAVLVWKLFRQRAFRSRASALPASAEMYRLFDQIRVELGCRKPGKLVVSARTATAYQAGFFLPYVVLPASDFSQQDISNMLRHELCHFMGGDLWIKVGSQVVAGLLWWNPVMRLFKRDVELLLEMRCDRRVCGRLSEQEQLAYLNTLLLLMRDTPVLTSTVSMGCLSHQADTDIFLRFRLILAGASPTASRLKRGATCSICAVLFLLSYLVLVQPASYPPEETSGEITGVNLEDSYLVRTSDGKYDFYCNGVYTNTFEEYVLSMEPFNQLPVLDRRMIQP